MWDTCDLFFCLQHFQPQGNVVVFCFCFFSSSISMIFFFSHPECLHGFPLQPAIFLQNNKKQGRGGKIRLGSLELWSLLSFPSVWVSHIRSFHSAPWASRVPLSPFRDGYLSVVCFFVPISHLASPISSHFNNGRGVL